MKLISKIFISGNIEAKTGLHIGGSKSSLDIGGVDLNVIKTPDGIPYIPGSSLKGKLRSMLARVKGSTGIDAKDVGTGEKSDEDFNEIVEIFGSAADDDGKGTVTRLYVRDAFLDTTLFSQIHQGAEMDFDYSDVKWENRINRKTGTAEMPRQIERVPAGAIFHFEMIYNNYDTEATAEHLSEIRLAMRLLEADYIGGHGSRGYGQISFNDVTFEEKDILVFKGDNKKKPYNFKF